MTIRDDYLLNLFRVLLRNMTGQTVICCCHFYSSVRPSVISVCHLIAYCSWEHLLIFSSNYMTNEKMTFLQKTVSAFMIGSSTKLCLTLPNQAKMTKPIIQERREDEKKTGPKLKILSRKLLEINVSYYFILQRRKTYTYFKDYVLFLLLELF